jgi:hypothetical protein
MSKLELKDWQEFEIIYNQITKKGLFDIVVGGDIKSINKHITPSTEMDKVCIVSNTSVNNGIIEEIEGFKTSFKNVITLATRGNDYKAFYHKDYYVLPVVRTICLLPHDFELNEYIAFFLSTMFNQNAYKYDYGRFLSGERIKQDKIKLPAKQNQTGEYEPDWLFMENYIKLLSKKVDFTNSIQYAVQHYNISKSFDSVEWKDFFLIKNTINPNGVFDILPHEKIDVNTTNIGGDTPLIARGSNNNNIHSFIDYTLNKDLAMTLTINLNGAIGKVFFHDYNYVTTQNVHVLKHNRLNKYNSLFFKTIIEFAFKDRYLSHGRELIQEKLIIEKIKLPAKQNQDGIFEPDWQYMENYIKSLPYSINL